MFIRYLQQIEEVVKRARITATYLFTEAGIYFFGCDNGYAYGLPLVHVPRQCYKVYSARVDPGSPVKFVYGKGRFVLCGSQRGRLLSLSLDMPQLSQSGPPQERRKS